MQEITRQLHAVSSILDYPAEYGYFPVCEVSAVTSEECSNTLPSYSLQDEEPIEVEAIRTYYGMNPPRQKYNKAYRPYDQKYTPTDYQAKQRSETLWRQRVRRSEKVIFFILPSTSKKASGGPPTDRPLEDHSDFQLSSIPGFLWSS